MLDANTAVLIGVVVFFLCGTYILAKYIKIAYETQVELKRLEESAEKPKTRSYSSFADAFMDAPLYSYKGEKEYKVPTDQEIAVVKDVDPTIMFDAVTDEVQRRYVAEDPNDVNKTTEMPKVEVERDDDR